MSTVENVAVGQFYGCLVDESTRDVVDAGVITLYAGGSMVVSHGDRQGRGKHVSPYAATGQHGILAIPPTTPN